MDKAVNKEAVEQENVEDVNNLPADDSDKVGNGDDAEKVGLDTEEADRIAKQRSERATKAAVESYFRQQGLSAKEAKEAFAAYKEQKAAEKEAEMNDMHALQEKVKHYEAEGSEMMKRANLRLIRAEAKLQAMSLNIRPDRVDHAIRLADLTNVDVDENGQADEEEIQKALQQVTKEIPELLIENTQEEHTQGFKLGGPGQQQSETTTEKLSSIFGND